MNNKLYDLTSGWVEDPDAWEFANWNDFIKEEPWNRNWLYDLIPAHWSLNHPDDKDWDCCLELVYVQLAPLRARSVKVILDPNEDDTKIMNLLSEHKFHDFGG